MQQGFRPQGAPGYPGMQMQRPGGVSGASSYPGAMAGPGPGPGPMHMSGLPGPPGGAGSMPQQLRPPMHPVSGGSAGAAPNVWTEHKAPDGRTYYHNKALGKSSWEKPAELLSSKEQKDAPASEWKEFTAPDGRKYYYNKVTKESKWSLPDELKQAREAAAGAKASPNPAAGSVQVVKLDAGSSPASVPNGASQASPLPTSSSTVKEDADGKPAAAATAATDAKFMYSSKEEAKDAFKELLASVQVNSDWSWEQTMRLIISDNRYSALKSLGEKKACFNEYVQQRKNEEVMEKRQRLKRAREDFTAMLEGTHDLRASTRYSAAAALLEDDPRWKAVQREERELLYADFIKEKDKREREAKKAERRRRTAAFRTLLEKSTFIKVDTAWRKAMPKLEGENEYEALDKLDRLEVYQDYILHLERKEKEAKEKEKEERRRRERKNRDAFKELLQRHLSEGVLVAKMRYKDYYPLIKKEESVVAVEKNLTGSTAKDLFEDALEVADAQFDKDKALLKDAAKDIPVQPDSTFDQFNAALEDIEIVKNIIKPNRKLVFDELLAKAKERAAKEEKRRKRARDDFNDLLRDTRSVVLDSSWDDIRPSLESAPEYKAISQEEREQLFTEYTAYLKEKAERRKAAEDGEEGSADKHKKKRHKEKKDKRDRDGADDEDKRHKRSKRDEDAEGGSEEKKSKRHKREKEKRHRSSRKSEPAADVGDGASPDKEDGGAAATATAAPAAAAPTTEEPAEDGEL
ncbi:hypothetical protein WJX75_000518 [Coccomyxa subellipsoidea]|uniref:WW domain-containing protein n=1 Tax=Coccomyxa subellipsoidea TaxID=248742 RepID=A0ABR2YEG2_9CHLO